TYSPLSSVLCRFTVTGERDARPRCATRRLCVSRLPPTHPSDPPISSVGSQGFACRGRRWLTPGGPPARADPPGSSAVGSTSDGPHRTSRRIARRARGDQVHGAPLTCAGFPGLFKRRDAAPRFLKSSAAAL
ncbi:hypothetical protein GW17_00045584, partial [Ensete ventricosum]